MAFRRRRRRFGKSRRGKRRGFKRRGSRRYMIVGQRF